MVVPVVGHIVVLGYLATVAIYAIENAVVVGGLSALGAALYSIGVPKDSVIQYESALTADDFLVMAHGTTAEIARAKAILGAANPSRLDVHTGAKVDRALGSSCAYRWLIGGDSGIASHDRPAPRVSREPQTAIGFWALCRQ